MKKIQKYWLPVAYILFFCSLKFLRLEKLEFPTRHVATKYLWSLGFAYDCDVTFSSRGTSLRYYVDTKNIKDGDTLWIEPKSFPKFFNKYLPQIQKKIVLVITNGQENFPGSIINNTEFESFLSDPRIVHVFAQNGDYTGESSKFSPIPLGIDFQTIENEGHEFVKIKSVRSRELKLDRILSKLKPTYSRKKKVLLDQHLEVYQELQNSKGKISLDNFQFFNSITAKKPICTRSDLWKLRGRYAFTFYPHYQKVDSNKVWEDLTLGCIVILQTKSRNPVYDGLPVIFIDDVSEINESSLTEWMKTYGDALDNNYYRKKLYHKFWMNRINEESKQARDFS